MPKLSNIATYFRLIFTAFTLVCALTLNHRELATYTFPVSNTPSEKAAVNHEAGTKDKTTVKQKVVFEAVTSFVVIHLDQFIGSLREGFTLKVQACAPVMPRAPAVVCFFQKCCTVLIRPNAP